MLGTVVQATNPDTPVTEDYRTAAQLVEEGARPQDVVVLSSPFTVYPFEYYYDGAARLTTLPVWDRQGPAPAYDPARLPEVLVPYRRSAASAASTTRGVPTSWSSPRSTARRSRRRSST